MTNTYTSPIKNPCENLKEPISPQRIEIRSQSFAFPADDGAVLDFSSEDNLWSFNANTLIMDNSNNTSPVSISIAMVGVNYNVLCAASSIHAYPIPAVPPFKATVSSDATSGTTILHVANFPMPAY